MARFNVFGDVVRVHPRDLECGDFQEYTALVWKRKGLRIENEKKGGLKKLFFRGAGHPN